MGRANAAARLEALAASDDNAAPNPTATMLSSDPADVAHVTMPVRPVENLRRNLEYALSLATAGLHLQQLKVEAFEVSDVYRAAWVQAVAALDHWIHQKLRERMVKLAETPVVELPVQLQKFQLPASAVDDIVSKRISFRDAVDRQWTNSLGGTTFQHPDKIRAGLAYVADVSQLWHRVADVLSEGGGDGVAYNADRRPGPAKAQ